MGNLIGKADITFSIFAIIVGLYFTHFADFLRITIIKRRELKFCFPHILMTIAVFFAAIQFIWSFDTLQFNIWFRDSYYNELGNFLFILVNSLSFYLIGQFLHPDREDLTKEIYMEQVNNQVKFSAIKFYQLNKKYVYIIIIFYLAWTSFSNMTNKYSQDSLGKQLTLNFFLVLLLMAGLVSGKKTKKSNKLDYYIPICCKAVLLLYLLVKGHNDFKLLNSADRISKYTNS
jgi:hypothetical protein